MGKRLGGALQLDHWLGNHTYHHEREHHVGGLYTVSLRPRADAHEVFEALRQQLAQSEAPLALGPAVSLHELWSIPEGLALLVSTDDDWSDRVPAGPGDDVIPGIAIIPFLDIAERNGISPDWWLARGVPNRSHLLSLPEVPWEVARASFDALAEHMGSERLRHGCRETADLTSETVTTDVQGVVGVIRIVHERVIRQMWHPVFAHVIPLRPGVTCVRMGVRAGLGGSWGLFHSHAGTLESLPRHLRLPFGKVTRVFVEGDGVRATYVLQHPTGLAPEAPNQTHPHKSALRSDELGASRMVARQRAGDALGARLSVHTNVHEFVEVFVDGLFALLPIHGLTFELVGPSGEVRPFRARGDTGGEHPVLRVLRYGERPVAQLTVYAPVGSSGELLAVMDLLQPWLAAGLGVGLETARLRRRRDVSEGETQVLFRAIDHALERLSRPAFTMEADGRIVPNNAAAREIASSDSTLPAKLASALGGPGEHFDRVLLPPEHGGMLVLYRTHPRSLDNSFHRLATNARLSPRRREVARLALAGRSVEQVAEALSIREGTVRAHLTSVYRALGVDGHVAFLVRCLAVEDEFPNDA